MGGASASLLAGSTVSGMATPPTSELSIYVVAWCTSEKAGKLPWDSSSPRYLAERFLHVIWRYFNDTDPVDMVLKGNAPHIVGHASLVAVFTSKQGRKETIVFSHTGALNLGVYRNPKIAITGLSDKRYPTTSPYTSPSASPILACARLDEVFAGHNRSGRWETNSEFLQRVKSHYKPNIRKVALSGWKADDMFDKLQAIREITKPSNKSLLGAPAIYGLNTTSIRLVDQFDKPLTPSSFLLDEKRIMVPGGCGNAVHGILEGIGLAGLVPENKAVFRKNFSIDLLKTAVLPIMLNQALFDANGKVKSKMLSAELEKISDHWGSGETAIFTDPNYWHAAIRPNEYLWREFRTAFGIR